MIFLLTFLKDRKLSQKMSNDIAYKEGTWYKFWVMIDVPKFLSLMLSQMI